MRWVAMVLVLVLPVSAWAQEVRLDRAEFIALLGNVAALQKKLALTEGEITLLIQAKDKRDEVIALQKGHIEELVALVADLKASHATEAELFAAVEGRLAELETSIRWRNIALVVQGAIIAGLAAKAWRGR